MNKAHLDILGFDLNLGKNNYIDLGYVDSVEKVYNNLRKDYRLKKDLDDISNCIGLFWWIKKDNKKNFYIFYERSEIEIVNIFIRAHEETHFVDETDELDLLAKRLWEDQRVKIDFGKITNEEVKANIGGFYSVHQREFYLEDLYILDKYRLFTPKLDRESYVEAKEIYELGKKPIKCFDFGENKWLNFH